MWHPAGKDEMSSYYFEGLCGFPNQMAIVLLFILLNVGVVLMLQLRWRSLAQHER